MKSSLLLLMGAAVLASAEAADSPPPANVHDVMKNVVAIQAQVIWDVGNNAQDDQGNPDASKLKAADWSKLGSAASKVKQASDTLATAGKLAAAGKGQKIDGEGNPEAPTAASVQKAIDANPAAFRAFAKALAVSMEQLGSAVQKKDAAKLADVSGTLDQLCEDCHKQFWYPEQKASL